MGIFIGGAQADFNSKIIVFGAFPIAYSKNKNDITLRGVPEIALIPSNNQGGKYFMPFLTGKRIHTFHWD